SAVSTRTDSATSRRGASASTCGSQRFGRRRSSRGCAAHATWRSRSCGRSPGSSRAISMIGNDIVDLGDSESHAEGRHPRFDGRVFDETEHALIDATPEPERVRWLLWAAKESAYKAARKED